MCPHVHKCTYVQPYKRAHTETCTHMYHTPIHTSRPADEQKEPTSGLSLRMRTVLFTQVGVQNVWVSPCSWFSLCSFKPLTGLSTQRFTPLLLGPVLGCPGCRHGPQRPSVCLPTWPPLAHMYPHSQLGCDSIATPHLPL